MTIVFVVPLSATIANVQYFQAKGVAVSAEKFFDYFGQYVTQPFEAIATIFENNVVGTFLITELVVTVFYAIIFFIGFVKAAPKNEYTDIEHGSSDWSKKGEQYQILNKDKGIILAENNYLPADKRGNVNVLVVGRIRIW